MFWTVRQRDARGNVTFAQRVNDFNDAFTLRNALIEKHRTFAWIEDAAGQYVGFQSLDSGPAKVC